MLEGEEKENARRAVTLSTWKSTRGNKRGERKRVFSLGKDSRSKDADRLTCERRGGEHSKGSSLPLEWRESKGMSGRQISGGEEKERGTLSTLYSIEREGKLRGRRQKVRAGGPKQARLAKEEGQRTAQT